MVLDKLRLRRVSAAQSAVDAALRKLDSGDVGGFYVFASQGYDHDPYYRNSLLLYGMKCLSSDDVDQTLRVFRRWYDLRPDDLLARWGLAAVYASRGAYIDAQALFPADDLGSNTLEHEIGNRLASREGQILDDRFFGMYRQRLKSVHTE